MEEDISVFEESRQILEQSMGLKGSIKHSLQQQAENADEATLEELSGFLAVLFELILATLVSRGEKKELVPFMAELIQTLKPILHGNEDLLPGEDAEIDQLLRCFLDTEGEA